MGPLIGPGSLDGFAVGVMMSGAFFLALTAPRRARRRPAVGAGTTCLVAARGGLAVRRPRVPRIPRLPGSPKVSEIPKQSGVSGLPEVSGARTLGADALEPGAFEAGAFGPSPFGAGPFAPGAERMAQPDEPGSYSDTGWHLTVGDDSRAAGGRRSRHRLNEPLPGTTSPDRAPRGGTSRDSGHSGSAAPGGTRRSSAGFPDSAFPDSAFPDSALPDDEAFPETGFPDVRFPDVEFPDDAFPDGTFGTSKRPDARRLPRHAAPAVGMGSKVSHWMTGLFASSEAGMGRWVGGGARG